MKVLQISKECVRYATAAIENPRQRSAHAGTTNTVLATRQCGPITTDKQQYTSEGRHVKTRGLKPETRIPGSAKSERHARAFDTRWTDRHPRRDTRKKKSRQAPRAVRTIQGPTGSAKIERALRLPGGRVYVTGLKKHGIGKHQHLVPWSLLCNEFHYCKKAGEL